jgi:hypothetical protein
LDDVRAILAENASVMASGGARSLGFGTPFLRIPLDVYAGLIRVYPALVSPDAREKTKAWKRLLADPDFQKLRVGKG